MKIDASFIQALVALAAILGGFYAVVTRPLLARMDDILTHTGNIDARLTSIEGVLREHGERLARVEERLPPPLVRR